MRYLLLLFTIPLAAAPILGPPDGNGYQMMLSGIPDPPAKRMPSAGEMAGLEAALFDYFSGFDWSFGPIAWRVQDSNSAGTVVGSAGGGGGYWNTDFIYSDGVVSSSLIDAGVLWDINEQGVAVGGSALDGLAYVCLPSGGCEHGNYFPRTPDPRNPDGPMDFSYFTGVDDSGNIWGMANAQLAYMHNGPVSFGEPGESASFGHAPEPGTWIAGVGILLLLLAKPRSPMTRGHSPSSTKGEPAWKRGSA